MVSVQCIAAIAVALAFSISLPWLYRAVTRWERTVWQVGRPGAAVLTVKNVIVFFVISIFFVGLLFLC